MSDDKMETVIGDDIVFKGNVRFTHSLRIKGQLKGNIESNGDLIIEETGQVDADISVKSVSVNGTIRGNIEAKEKIEVSKTGVVIGDIKSPLLDVETGAKFTGNCSM